MRAFSLFAASALVGVLAVSPSLAQQEGRIALFADALGNDCNVEDLGVGSFSVYVLLLDHDGAFSTDFSLVGSAGFAGTWVSDTHVYQTTQGQAPTGVSVIMSGCVAAPTHVLTANYMGTGLSSTCSSITPMENAAVFPDGPAITTCAIGAKRAVPTELIRVNPDGFCDCVVPVEETTWGAIKELYSDRP